MNVSTGDTEPRGAICSLCQDHFGAWQTLTGTWQKYRMYFSDFSQIGWGRPRPAENLKFDATRAYEVQFLVQPAGRPFDFWIDDVVFILR